MAGFIFGAPGLPKTQADLDNLRKITLALAMRPEAPPHNVGEGLTAIGNALAYRSMLNDLSAGTADVTKQQAGIWSGLPGMDSGTPATPAAPASAAPSPATPAPPSANDTSGAALSPAPLSQTPQPLSGGGLPQDASALTGAVAKLESGGRGVNGPAGRYVNELYQQFPAFAKQYGSGADGVTNYAKQVAAANPNATFGDMYGGYVTGTGNPATAAIDSLKTTTQPGAQGAYGNLVRNSPVDPKTPLSQLLASGLGDLLGPASAYADVPKSGDTLLQQPQAAGPGAMPAPPTPGAQAAPLPPATQIASLLSGAGSAPQGQPAPNQQIAQALTGGFTPGAMPNVTNLQTKPVDLPAGMGAREAVSRALMGQGAAPVAAPGPAAPQAPAQPVLSPTQRQQIEWAKGVISNPVASKEQQAVAAGIIQKHMDPPKGVNVNGHLVDPASGREIADFSNKPTNDQLNYKYYLSTLQPGEKPMDFATWTTAKAKAGATSIANNIDMGGPQAYDKQLADSLGKSHAALATGVEDAQKRAMDIAAMQGAIDQIQKNGGSTGGMGQAQVLALKKTINDGATALGMGNPFSEGDISDKEFLQKFNRQMAGAQAKGAVGARVTNFEMSNFLKSNPGLDMSITGNQRLLGIQAQIEQRNIAVGNDIRNATAQAIAQGKRIDPVTVQKIISSYDEQHHISDPVTGQDLTQSYTLPEFQKGGTNPQKAQEHGQNIQKLQGKTDSGIGWSVH